MLFSIKYKIFMSNSIWFQMRYVDLTPSDNDIEMLWYLTKTLKGSLGNESMQHINILDEHITRRSFILEVSDDEVATMITLVYS
jgi:hypothetical protein